MDTYTSLIFEQMEKDRLSTPIDYEFLRVNWVNPVFRGVIKNSYLDSEKERYEYFRLICEENLEECEVAEKLNKDIKEVHGTLLTLINVMKQTFPEYQIRENIDTDVTTERHVCKCEEKVLTMKVVKLDNCLGLPEYKTVGSAGMDLYASIDEDIVLGSLERVMIPTGIKIELPIGYEAQVRPRSGKAIKDGITVINTPGTVDSDFRGEVQVLAVNLSRSNQVIRKGERIAQMVITNYQQPVLNVVTEDELSVTERGENGFGSTNKF